VTEKSSSHPVAAIFHHWSARAEGIDYGGDDMSKVELHAQAPDFALQDFRGQTVRLADYQGQKHVVLVFNRGFT
jgi:hypothetical protein